MVSVSPMSGRDADTSADDEIVVVRQRRYGQMAAAAILLAALAWIVVTMATSKNIQWGQFRHYLFYRTILSGTILTIKLTALSMVGGISVGILAALMRLSSNRVLTLMSTGYVWLFRGTPLLVQVIFWYNLALFVPRLGFGSLSTSTNTVMTSFIAALIALILNSGAYLAEIVRGGILSVDTGQTEAALALGMSRREAMARIVLPQALRVIIPATGNQLIGLLKDTSLVSVIAAQELLTQAQIIYSRNFLVIELLLVASFWYLVMTTVASIGQQWLERRLDPDTRRARPIGTDRMGWRIRRRPLGPQAHV